MPEAVRHPGAMLRAARFFHDPRGSMRALLDSGPGEARLAAYAFAAVAVLLAGRVAGIAAADGLDPGMFAAQAGAMLFFVPLAWYGLAGLGTALARAFRGKGGWRDGRAAFFWAALVSSPVMALSGLAPALMSGAPAPAVALAAQIGPVFFAWALAQCYAEAFGFRRAWAVFGVIAALVLLVVAGASGARL